MSIPRRGRGRERLLLSGRQLLSSAFVVASLTGCTPIVEEPVAVPQRIIAVAPNLVEILFELGLEDRVVAVGDHCEWPPEAAAKPRIGGLLDPRLETIAALEPDLAILLPSEQALATGLRRFGIEVLVTPVETLRDVELAIEAVADRVGSRSEGSRLVARLSREVAPRPVANGLPVLLVVGREPGSLSDVYAVGGETFLDELLDRLGGVNVVGDSPMRYPQIGLEEISVRRPQVIVELQPLVVGAETEARLVADWQRELPGFSPCVVVVDGDHVLVPGPRIGVLFDDLAAALRSCGDPA